MRVSLGKENNFIRIFPVFLLELIYRFNFFFWEENLFLYSHEFQLDFFSPLASLIKMRTCAKMDIVLFQRKWHIFVVWDI